MGLYEAFAPIFILLGIVHLGVAYYNYNYGKTEMSWVPPALLGSSLIVIFTSYL